MAHQGQSPSLSILEGACQSQDRGNPLQGLSFSYQAGRPGLDTRLVRARDPGLAGASVGLTATITEPTEQVTSHSLLQPPKGPESIVPMKLHVSPSSWEPGKGGATQREEKVLGVGRCQGRAGGTQYHSLRGPPALSHTRVDQA